MGGLCLAILCFPAAPALAALGQPELRELEEYLARLGFDPGEVDGVADERTAAAIRDYQAFAALPEDGEASPALLEELRGLVATLSEIRTARPEEPVPEATPEPPAEAPPDPEDTAPAAGAEPAPDAGPGWAFALHLASLRKESGAREEWARLRERLPDLFAGMSHRIVRVDLGEQGIYHRLFAGPFPNAATAADLCAQIQIAGQRCRVVRGPDETASPPSADGARRESAATPALAHAHAGLPRHGPARTPNGTLASPVARLL